METLSLSPQPDKAGKYAEVTRFFSGLLEGESDATANMANLCALLREHFGFWWTGFYLVRGEELVLGPFQGPVACTRIAYGKGVCGSSWQRGETIAVPDVHQFPGHIACSAASNSEIVVPLKRNGQIIGVLDIDSEHFGHFDDTDARCLEELCRMLAEQSSFA